MKETVKLPGGVFTLMTNPRHLPETRRIEFECYRIIESGIGAGMADVDRHFDTFIALLNGKKYDDLLPAINNLRFLFFGMLNKQITPRSLALACLVDSVDGEPVNDLSEKGLESVVNRLSAMGINDEIIADLFDDSKKKSIPN